MKRLFLFFVIVSVLAAWFIAWDVKRIEDPYAAYSQAHNEAKANLAGEVR